MPRRAEVAVTLAAAACALAATTIGRRADAKVTWQGTGLATAGWTDNILNAPDQTTVGAAPRESDVFFQLAPGALMTQAAPRILERLGYVFTADLFARHSEANSYTNALTWFADVATSPTTRLTLSLDTTQGRLSTFALNQSSADATVGVLTQNNSTNYFKQGATQGLVATPLPEWRFAESLAFGAFIPIDRGRMPDGYTLTAELGADRTFRTNAFGLVLRESFIDFVQPRDPLTDVPLDFDSQQLLTTALARWRRDWSASWNTVAELGVISVVAFSANPAIGTTTAWQPSALASLRWARLVGSVELHYAHTATPNVLVGTTVAVDEVALQGIVPYPKFNMVFSATAGYQHAHILPLVPTIPESSADLAVADVTVAWQPIPELRVFARYSLFDQFGNVPTAMTPLPLLPDLTRSVLMIGATVLYPVVATVRAPTGAGSRVDETDQPEFPEPHAAEPQ